MGKPGPNSMKALVFTEAAADASASRVATVPTPTPGVGQLAIAVQYAGINFKDVMARRGDPGYVTSWPFVPGLEVAGTVCGIGPQVTGFAVGERVVALTNSGGLAEVAIARAALTVHVSDGLELVRASAVPGAMTTAALLLDRFARIRPGDSILVHSASGSVGHAVAALARRQGDVRLIGSVGAPSRVAMATRAGYDAAFVRGDGLARDVRGVLAGEGVDVVLNPQGTHWLEQDLSVLAPGGRVIIFGNAGGGHLDALPPPQRFLADNASVGGFSLAALSAAAPQLVAAAMTTVLEQLARATLSPSIVEIVEIDGLARAAQAQQLLADGAGAGKYVVRLTRSPIPSTGG